MTTFDLSIEQKSNQNQDEYIAKVFRNYNPR